MFTYDEFGNRLLRSTIATQNIDQYKKNKREPIVVLDKIDINIPKAVKIPEEFVPVDVVVKVERANLELLKRIIEFDKITVCKPCGLEFLNDELLNEHVLDCHSEGLKKKKVRFSDEIVVLGHIDYNCGKCVKQFHCSKDLKRHERYHLRLKNKKLEGRKRRSKSIKIKQIRN